MPIIEVHLMEGRTTQQKCDLADEMTAAVVKSLGVKEASVRILITDHKKDGFFVAGKAPALK